MPVIRTEYNIEHGKPVVYSIARNTDGTRTLSSDNAFEPYLYVPWDEKSKVPSLLKAGTEKLADIFGNDVCRVTCRLPSDVPKIKELFSRTWEADVPFNTRYMIDKLPPITTCPIRVAYIDIETTHGGKVPNPYLAEHPIVCIGIFDATQEIYYTLIWKQGMVPGNTATIYDDCLHEIKYFKDECSMLNGFIAVMKEIEPDILSGWNITGFDLPYIYNRCILWLINPGQLSPLGHTFLRDEPGKKGEVVIKGLAVVDLMTTYMHVVPNREESYSLDFIASKVNGDHKLGTGSGINFLWANNPEELISYNVNDVRITKNIEKTLGLIDFLCEMQRLCCGQLEDMLAASKMASNYILKLYHGKKIFPSKSHVEHEPFEGAFVGVWAKGIYNNVAVFDLKSLYPSIIVSGNFSPETIAKDTDIDVVKINGTAFVKSPQGFLPEVINNLFEERAKYKKLMKGVAIGSPEYKLYDSRQYSVKILLNSLYGQTAFPGSRLYSPKIAEAITYMGREIIKWSKNKIEEKGYEVLLVDTDSLFVHRSDGNLGIEEAEGLRGMLNASYGDFSRQFNIDKHIFDMQFEKLCRRAFFGAAKKRYAMHVVWKDGRVVDQMAVTGFEIRRSDSSHVTKDIMSRVFEMLLKEDRTKEQVMEYLVGELDKIKLGQTDLSDLGIPKGVSKEIDSYAHPPANIRGIIYARDNLGIVLSNKPKMVYISKMPVGFPPADVLCFDEWSQIPPGTQIDITKMIDKVLKAKIEPIFDALGWRISELNPFWKQKVKGEGEQLKLM